jgi:DNA-binding SARP family transcriptional activator/tetratricopeptide (TPR) repeat protein
MASSDEASMPSRPEQSPLLLLRESGDALEAVCPPFDVTAGAARLREVARAYGLLRSASMPGDDLAVTDARLEEQAPPFDVEAGAVWLRQAAQYRGLLPEGVLGGPGGTRAPAGAGLGMEFKILGQPELLAEGCGGVTVSPQLWCVLLSLLLAPTVSVPTEILAERLWGDKTPPKAQSTIRSYIWRIDRVLSQVAGNAVHVRRQVGGYALDVDPSAVDLHRFRSLRRQSDALAESGELEPAAALLTEAEGLWRGRALAGLPGDWIRRVRDTLEEELRSATTHRIELDLMLGRHAGLLTELSELAERHPFDEVLAAHLMVALFRSGRQADALHVYRKTCARLATEGLEPSPSLARLHRRVLRHDPELAITPVYRRAERGPQPNTLPPDIGDFVGRTKELRFMTGETEPRTRPALVVIEGTGGAGKTALAVRAGHTMASRYPDAQLFLNFRAHDQLREPLDPADALRDLLMTLDVPAVRVPGSLRARAELWRTELSARRALLIFDDVTGPEQVLPLLPPTGDCLVIITSRQCHLDWGQARPLMLRALPENEAAELFVQIAGRVTEDELIRVTRITRLCDCLPLAIRLAASRLRSGTVSSLADLLDELEGSSSRCGQGDEAKHRIQGALELSYRQLPESARHFFRYLGISPCIHVSAHPAAVLTGHSLADARTALGVLSGHRLLEKVPEEQFGIHDLVRVFAASQAYSEDPEEELRLAVGRLADYYLHAVKLANEVLSSHQREVSFPYSNDPLMTPFKATIEAAAAWLESEWDNALRIAHYCARHEWQRRCVDLVHELGEFLETSGRWNDALAAHRAALQACRDLDHLPGIARAAFDLSLTMMRIGHGELALQHAAEAATILRTLGDKRGQAAALDRIGIIHRDAAKFRDALACHREAIEIYQETDDRLGLAKALVHAGMTLGSLGRSSEQMEYLNEALSTYSRIGDMSGQAITLNNIGTAQYHRKHHEDAMRSYQSSLDIFHKIGGTQYLTILEHNIGRLRQHRGDHEAAITTFRRTLATYRSTGDLRHQAYALSDIGSAYRSADRFEEALAHHIKAASVAEAARDHYAYAEALCGIAEAHFGSGHLNAALESYEQATKLAEEIEALYIKARALNGIAEIMLRIRGTDLARVYWREAHDTFAQLSDLRPLGR